VRYVWQILALALLGACGSGECGDPSFLEALLGIEPEDCREHGDPRPPDDGIRPGMLIALHIASGDVLAIRDEHTGTGVVLKDPIAIELSADGDHAYIADGAGILRVRIQTGDAVHLSDATHGSGVDFSTPVGLEWESGTGRLLVHDQGLDAVIAVDPFTGNRSETVYPYSPASIEEERRVRDDSIGVEYIVFKEETGGGS